MDAYVAEFVGTCLLVLLGNGVVANVVLTGTKGHGSGWIVITFGWGMGVFVAVMCVMEESGAHINPAVTVGLAVAGRFAWQHVAGYIAGQMLGAITGAALVYLVYRDHFATTYDTDAQLAAFCTAPAIRHPPANFFCELVGTAVLVLAVLMVAEPSITYPPHETGAPHLQPARLGLGALGALPVGLLVFAIGLSLGGPTGYAINPARDLGPRIAYRLLPIPGKRDADWSYAWVPVLGPLAGGLAAAAIYAVVRSPADVVLK